MSKKQKTKCDEPIFNDEDEPYLLKIDWDWIPPRHYIDMYKGMIHYILEWFSKLLVVGLDIQCFRSKSKNGLHWYIKYNTKVSLTKDQKCELQFLLGDDKKRCKLNWQSIQIGLDDWNKFYEDYYYKKVG